MLKLLQLLESRLLNDVTILDKVRPISKIKEMAPDNGGFDKYALTYELINDKDYKNRKGKHETSLFLNCYSNVDNGDLAVLHLAKLVKETLDEVDLTDATLGIKTHYVKYDKSTPQPEKNKKLQAWQTVVAITIRWEENE